MAEIPRITLHRRHVYVEGVKWNMGTGKQKLTLDVRAWAQKVSIPVNLDDLSVDDREVLRYLFAAPGATITLSIDVTENDVATATQELIAATGKR